MTENAVAKKDAVMGLIERLESGVSQALPTHVAKDAFMRALQTSLRKEPKLMRCDKTSVSSAVMSTAQFGLVIGYTAHLIPFGQECVLVIDYKGFIDMAYRHDRVRKIMADVICENDEFEYTGFGRPIHKKNLHSRGKEYAAFAYCELEGCEDPIVNVMANDEIEKVRRSSRAANDGPWVQWWGEMAKKTAIKRLCKIIPKSIELQAALEYDDSREAEQAREVQATVVESSIDLNDLIDGNPEDHTEPSDPIKKNSNKKESNNTTQESDGTPESYRFLYFHYREHQQEIDECLKDVELPADLNAIDPEHLSASDKNKLDKAKDKFAKKLASEGK